LWERKETLGNPFARISRFSSSFPSAQCFTFILALHSLTHAGEIVGGKTRMQSRPSNCNFLNLAIDVFLCKFSLRITTALFISGNSWRSCINRSLDKILTTVVSVVRAQNCAFSFPKKPIFGHRILSLVNSSTSSFTRNLQLVLFCICAKVTLRCL